MYDSVHFVNYILPQKLLTYFQHFALFMRICIPCNREDVCTLLIIEENIRKLLLH